MTEQTQTKDPHYPEEYITGKVMFFGREFRVTPDVLIPRLETECLIRRARDLIGSQDFDVIVDIGTGSGIIITSIADRTRNGELFGLDISPDALLVAKGNFQEHYAHQSPYRFCHFLQMDLLEGFAQYLGEKHQNILFLANLPYIKGGDWKNMSADTHFEPEVALFGGEETGFELYEKLFEEIQALGISGICIIEFGFDQRQIAEKIIQEYDWKYEFFSDYAGIERFVEISL